MTEQLHPTAAKLVLTVSEMLDSEHPHDILVDEVLRISGVNRGSLYHFFGDFPSLIRATLLRRYSANVSADARAMRSVAETAQSSDEYWSNIRELSTHTQVSDRAPVRAERARLLSLSSSDAAFAEALAAEQQTITSAMAESIAVAQQKGWVDAQLSPSAIAVFLQAYSLGRAVDDVSTNHVSDGEWQRVVERAISSFRA